MKKIFWFALLSIVLFFIGWGVHIVYKKFGIWIFFYVPLLYILLGIITLGLCSRWGIPRVQNYALEYTIFNGKNKKWQLEKGFIKKFKEGLAYYQKESSKKFDKADLDISFALKYNEVKYIIPYLEIILWPFYYIAHIILFIALCAIVMFLFSKQGFRLLEEEKI